MNQPHQTIAALSTPSGRAAIALIRLSGPDALLIARRLFTSGSPDPPPARRSVLGSIHGREGGQEIDTGCLTYYPAGRSYTGEDLVELTCHGNPVVVERILEELLAAGARPASPGEFTYRAVVNGRMDLAQAEGVRDFIEAATRGAAEAALGQLRGALSSRVEQIKDALVEAICRAEASIEFAEEPDVAASEGNLAARLAGIRTDVEELLRSYRQGRLLREGARVVIAGRTNAGKSSLFNALLDTERAIVSDRPGTTRDFLSERIDLAGVPVTLIDTAGLGDEADPLEREGMARTRAQAQQADVVVLLCPCDEPLQEADERLMAELQGRALLAAGKIDRPSLEWASEPRVGARVSSVTREGLAPLREAIGRRLGVDEQPSGRRLLVTSARHHAALADCAARLAAAGSRLAEGLTEEVVVVELHAALASLGDITAPVSPETIYDRIFSTFCIGK
ncbi:MAG TPA: tRNA uridine-5-carboxymethylaminomethyl(34) synthesis GTPase MnmE [Candidatus Polarisedimenticolia bacterium]|nr:tRNA uridine-5-carboxymethylaminomethyl(34) synthesis GTPase MnmE [Candidatus Polarisedimenticolia bacterium]